MTVSTFFHAGILVRNLEEAIPRFEHVLGLKFLKPNPFTMDRFVDIDHFGDDEPHPWSGIAAYSSEGPPYYELLEAKGRGTFSLDGREEGLHHLGMIVDDVRAMHLSLVGDGVEPSGLAYGGTDGRQLRVFFTKPGGLHGVSLEVIESTSPVIARLMEEAREMRGETG